MFSLTNDSASAQPGPCTNRGAVVLLGLPRDLVQPAIWSMCVNVPVVGQLDLLLQLFQDEELG